MRIITRVGHLACVAAAGALLAATAGCGIDKQSAPPLAGPSEFGLSLQLTATPAMLTRDGSSQATVVALLRNANGAPAASVPLNLTVTPGHAGVLSAAQILTGQDGRATFVFTAPDVQTAVSQAVIGVTPIQTDFANSVTHTTTIGLIGPAAADPVFTVAPEAPQRFELTVLNASGTTLDGVSCGSNCSYVWDLGGEATLTGQVVSYRFQQQRAYTITLSVTSPGGVVTRRQQTITVGAAIPATAVFSVSPSDPKVGDTVRVNASGSTPTAGATIVEYLWDFGNGEVKTGVEASTAYTQNRSFTIRLTVRDSNGQTATATQQVTVAVP